MIETSGAVAVGALNPDHPDAPVAAHYGDPMREQRVLATEVGFVDRSHRGVISVAGADRLAWLHSLTSQHLTGLPAMTGTELLLLSPHGHVEEHAVVVDDGSTTWLDVPAERVQPLLDFLSGMVFMMRVTPVDAGQQRALFTLTGPATDEALTRLGVAPLPAAAQALPVPPAKFAAGSVPGRASATYPAVALPAFDGLVRRTVDGADLLVARAAGPDLARAAELAGIPYAGIWAHEALRVAARRPRYGFETDHRTLPAEVGWFAAVHLDKGCYRGQESVARVHHLGRPPRRLVLLHLDGVSEEAPVRHAPVVAGGTAGSRPVGMIGTGVRHFELGTIALALVRQNVRDDAQLRVGDAAAMIDPG